MATSIIRNSDIVQVVRAPIIETVYNNPKYDWDNAFVVASGRGSVQDFLSTEDDTDRQTTTSGLRLISDDPALFNSILPTDRLRYDGTDYEFDGKVQNWRLFGKLHHIEIYVKKVIG